MIDRHRAALQAEIHAFNRAHPGGFAFRSCWRCNPGHERLKECEIPLLCFDCGHWYLRGEQATEDAEPAAGEGKP